MAQEGVDFELIVVDDNPPDERAATATALAPWRQDPRLRVVEHGIGPNVAAARNAGLVVARGDWVSYLDDDDTYNAHKLAAQMALAERTGSPLVLCGLRYRIGPRQRVRQCGTRLFAGGAIALDAQGTTQVLFHRREARAIFDPTFEAAEDQELFLRLVKIWNLSEVPNVPEPLVDVYPQTMGSRVNDLSPALWQAQRRICLRYARSQGCGVRRRWVARTALLRERNRCGDLAGLGRASIRLLAVGGAGEGRLILNTWMLRVPGLRQWVVT